MMPFEKCPICGGELKEKKVENFYVVEIIRQRYESMLKFAFIAGNGYMPKRP